MPNIGVVRLCVHGKGKQNPDHQETTDTHGIEGDEHQQKPDEGKKVEKIEDVENSGNACRLSHSLESRRNELDLFRQ